MQWLGHRAKLEFGTTRHAEAETDGALNLIRTKFHQPCAGGSAGHGADGAGGMPPAFIMIQVDAVADCTQHFNTGDIGIQNRLAI